jgi:hypothetical protein
MEVVTLRGGDEIAAYFSARLYFQGEGPSSAGQGSAGGPNGGPPTSLPVAFSKIA